MQKIDPAFLFELGPALRRVRDVNKDVPLGYAAFLISMARDQIEMAVEGSVYAHLVRGPARVAKATLFGQIDSILERNGEGNWSQELVGVYSASALGEA